MTNQETIYNLLAVEGDCWHKVEVVTPEIVSCPKCNNFVLDDPPYNPDLTASGGAFWLLKRLPAWDRFEEFCAWLILTKVIHKPSSTYKKLANILTWLGKDPSALYKALCEFLDLKVET